MKLKIGLTVLVLMVLCCWCLPELMSEQSSTLDIDHHLEGPSARHWLGTDSLGRDLLVRVLEGGRLSISVGLVSGLLVLAVGTLVGGAAALASPWLDRLLMRVADFGLMMPSLLLAILVGQSLGRGFWAIVVSISIVSWAPAAKFVRISLGSLLVAPFVEGARACGVSQTRLLFAHLLPHLMLPVSINAFYQVPQSILTESFLSFLGLGVQPPQASWGSLASEGFRGLQSFPHLLVVPGVAIFILMMALLLIVRGLQERT